MKLCIIGIHKWTIWVTIQLEGKQQAYPFSKEMIDCTFREQRRTCAYCFKQQIESL